MAGDGDQRMPLELPSGLTRGRPLVLALPDGLKICPVCGVGFLPPPKGPAKIYCDVNCRTLAHNREVRAAAKRPPSAEVTT